MLKKQKRFVNHLKEKYGNKCANCGKYIPQDKTFCNWLCAKEHEDKPRA